MPVLRTAAEDHEARYGKRSDQIAPPPAGRWSEYVMHEIETVLQMELVASLSVDRTGGLGPVSQMAAAASN